MIKETGTRKATPSVHLSFPFQKAMRKRQVWNDLQLLKEKGPQ
jgi:hypothetical protein